MERLPELIKLLGHIAYLFRSCRRIRRADRVVAQPQKTGRNLDSADQARLSFSNAIKILFYRISTRHASAVLTVGAYAQAVNAEKTEAQDAIVRLVGDPRSGKGGGMGLGWT